MGLEGVEIVLSCEDEFCVELTDSEVATFLTSRDMIEPEIGSCHDPCIHFFH